MSETRVEDIWKSVPAISVFGRVAQAAGIRDKLNEINALLRCVPVSMAEGRFLPGLNRGIDPPNDQGVVRLIFYLG